MEPTPYVIAIPSYERAEILRDQTLEVLISSGVPSRVIHVFVANPEEAEIYGRALPRHKYKEIVVGVRGITEQRKFISAYFPVGTKIVSMDDDVRSLLILGQDGKMHVHDRLDAFFREAFVELEKRNLFLWGVFPTPNPFYMVSQAPVTSTLKFVIGTVHGYINRGMGHTELLPTVPEKEDVQFTIAHYIKDGGVLRYNHVSFKTKFKNPKGGLGGIEHRFEPNREAAEYLVETYPQYCRLKIRKNGMHEVVLKAPKTIRQVPI